MHRAAILLLLLLSAGRTSSAATLSPSADPAADFIAVADSLARSAGDAGLSAFVHDNGLLVGAAVAKLLDAAFQTAEQGDAAGEKENVALARRIADVYKAGGGTAVAGSLVDSYASLTPAQRKLRARAIKFEEDSGTARKGGDIPKAVELLTQARALYEKIGDRHSVAVNWGTMGVAHWGTGDWNVVIQDYEQALAARRAVEDRILEGRTLNGLGTAYQQKGEWDRSADYYRQAIELRRSTGDLPGLGTSMTYLGHVFTYTGRYVDARNQYEATLPILESLGNPGQMVEILTGIGTVNSEMGREAASNEAYQRAITLASKNGLPAYEALCRRNLADNFRGEGRFAEALDELATAQPLVESADPVEKVRFHLTRGMTYLNMGEFDDAREDLLAASELAKSTDTPAVAIGAQISIGYLYRELGAFDRALKAVDDARQMAETAGDGRNYREAMILRGDLQRRVGRLEEALASWQEALAQDRNDQAEAAMLVDEVSIASIHALMGKNKEARSELRALAPRTRGADLFQVEWARLFALGHSFEKENADSAAYYYDRAMARIEASGAKIGGAEIQTGFITAETRNYYEEVVRFDAATYARTHDPAWSSRAFVTIERAKSRGLLELLRTSVSARTSPEEDKVLDAIYTLDPKQAGYADERKKLEQQYVDLRRQREESAVGSLSPRAKVPDIATAARLLPKKTVMLEYALGDSASFLWAIDRKGSDLIVLPPRPQIEGNVRRLRDAIARVDGGADALRTAARSLYRTLLAPAAGRLEGAETVVIVPDGALFELPFEVLLTRDPVAGSDWKQQPFFSRARATLYAPSASVYASLKSAPRSSDYTHDLLAVGNPDFTALAPRGGDALGALPYAEAEVDAIGRGVKDSRKVVLRGAAASEAAVKRELRTSPRVVHLATHGLVDAEEPARSSVALAPGDGEDGYFHTLEILGTPTHSRLVVMSACESARGRVARGEGVVGLSRAFLAAGSESVVASLWAVSDESTAELMKVFYEGMFGKKHSASRALNEARLALIDGGKFSHPFYWSPFVVTGTERAPW